MIYKYLLSPFAELDLDSIQEWYIKYDQVIFKKFDIEFENCLGHILSNPHQYPVVHNSIRRAILKQFPYSLFFKIIEDRIIILSVIHHKRNPKIWKKRKV